MPCMSHFVGCNAGEESSGDELGLPILKALEESGTAFGGFLLLGGHV